MRWCGLLAATDDGHATQGRNFIDRLFSTTALDLTLRYMRDKLHAIAEVRRGLARTHPRFDPSLMRRCGIGGQDYGFLDLSLAFSIELDFTLASGYDRHQHRREIQCAAPPPEHGYFSGNKGDDGPCVPSKDDASCLEKMTQFPSKR